MSKPASVENVNEWFGFDSLSYAAIDVCMASAPTSNEPDRCAPLSASANDFPRPVIALSLHMPSQLARRPRRSPRPSRHGKWGDSAITDRRARCVLRHWSQFKPIRAKCHGAYRFLPSLSMLVVPKTKCTALGMELYVHNEMTITQRRKRGVQASKVILLNRNMARYRRPSTLEAPDFTCTKIR